ncbi:hypothetical protein DMA15_18235 [Streptomyces sp. WAC 01529]|nr:hypothetical protein DMA15_18235 [Streptomyces sp. WAC 01529]
MKAGNGSRRRNELRRRAPASASHARHEGRAAPDHSGGLPAIYLSVPARDRVVVEVGTERYEAHAAPVDEAEHDGLWRQQIEQDPNFAEFRARAPRPIPVIALTRAGVTPSAAVRPHATSASCRS